MLTGSKKAHWVEECSKRQKKSHLVKKKIYGLTIARYMMAETVMYTASATPAQTGRKVAMNCPMPAMTAHKAVSHTPGR